MPAFNRSRQRSALMFAAIVALLSFAALFQYLRIPTDPTNAVFWGFSRDRLALMSLPAGLILLAAAAAWCAWTAPRWFLRGHAAWLRWVEDPRTRRRRAFAILGVAAALFILLNFTTWEAVLDRLRPLLSLGMGLCLAALAFAPIQIDGWRETTRRSLTWAWSNPQRSAGIIFACTALLFFGSAQAIEAFGHDVIGWNTTGAPLLDVQLTALVLLIGAGLLIRSRRGWQPAHSGRTDWVIFFLVWGLAAAAWTTLPLKPSWYLAEPQPPTSTFAPNSDALVYDLTAQNMLVGEGLRTRSFDDIQVRRPTLTFFFGLLHAAAGQDYAMLAVLQSALLAVFPALAYLVTRDLSGRLAGLCAALLVVIRESNAILLSDRITVAHAKLLMSDLPTAIGVAAFLALILPWMHHQTSRPVNRLLAAGGLLGALVMIRPETILLLPAAAAFALPTGWRRAAKGSAWMGVGLFLVLLPWLTRNYLKTGEIFIEVPGNRASFLVDRLFSEPAGPVPTPTPAKVAPAPAGQDAADPLRRIASHFLHNNFQAFLVFPATFRPADAGIGYLLNREADRFRVSCCSGANYIERLPFWQWHDWDLRLPRESVAPVLFNLMLFSVGLAAAWRKLGPAGWMPFAYGELHMLVNALARTSGGRYLLPVDWIWMAYFAIGLAAVCLWAFRLLAPLPGWKVIDREAPAAARPTRPASPYLAASLLLLFGAALPIGERLFPAVYPQDAPQDWVANAAAAPEILALLEDPDAAILHGRSLYVRSFPTGEGAFGLTFPNLYPQPFPRLTLFIAGPVSSGVVLPLDALPDLPADPELDVLAIGCVVQHPKQIYLDAAVVYFPALDLLVTRPGLPASPACPLPPP